MGITDTTDTRHPWEIRPTPSSSTATARRRAATLWAGSRRAGTASWRTTATRRRCGSWRVRSRSRLGGAGGSRRRGRRRRRAVGKARRKRGGICFGLRRGEGYRVRGLGLDRGWVEGWRVRRGEDVYKKKGVFIFKSLYIMKSRLNVFACISSSPVGKCRHLNCRPSHTLNTSHNIFRTPRGQPPL